MLITGIGRLKMSVAGPTGSVREVLKRNPSRAVSVPAPKARLLTSTKPASLSELTYGGIPPVTSQLHGRWGAKGGRFRFHNPFVS